jgi:hypothetical protein
MEQKMKLELTDRQWKNIEFSLLIAVSHTEKTSSMKYENNPLIKSLMKTYEQISEAREKINNEK